MADQQVVIPLEDVTPYRATDLTQIATAVPSNGGWTSPLIWANTENSPQLYTQGDGIHTTAGLGVDDTIHYPTEKAALPAALSSLSDIFEGNLGHPSRSAIAISGNVQLFDNFTGVECRRLFFVSNNPGEGITYYPGITYYLASDMHIISQDEYEHVNLESAVVDGGAVDVACALVEPDAVISELLAFYQMDQTVYCKPVEVPQESRDWVHEAHIFDVSETPPYVQAMEIGDRVVIAANGRLPDNTAAWQAVGFEADLFYSSLQACTLEDRKVLLLRLDSSNVCWADVISYEDGVVTVLNTTQIGTEIINLYQAVTSNFGLEGGDRSRVAFTCRTVGTGVGRAYVLTANENGVIIEGTATISRDFSHAAWCLDRIVVLAKAGYNATDTGGTGLNWGRGTVILSVYDQNLGLLSQITPSNDFTNGIEQSAAIHGFADGRLFMHASSFLPVTNDIGHTYEHDAGGIRLYTLAGSTLTLQDQIAESNSIIPAAMETYRLSDDVVIGLGRTGETFGSSPGDEDSMFDLWFCGGVQKEGNSDVKVYRLSDEWVVTIEPDKNAVWPTSTDFVTPDYSVSDVEVSLGATWIRAHHITSDGDVDIIGAPSLVHYNGNWYNVGCRVDDTHFMTVSRGHVEAKDSADNVVEAGITKVFEIDSATGNLAEVGLGPVPGGVGTQAFRCYAVDGQTVAGAGSGITWQAPQVVNEGLTFGGGTTLTLEPGAWDFRLSIGLSSSATLTTTITARDVDTDAVIISEGESGFWNASGVGFYDFRIHHTNRFTLTVALSGGAGETVKGTSKLSGACREWGFFNGLEQTTDTSGIFVVLGGSNRHTQVVTSQSDTLRALTFTLDDDYQPIEIDNAVIEEDPEGPGFPDRNPYGLTKVTDAKYVATWVRTMPNHFSAHTAFIVSSAGLITVGTTLDPEVDAVRYGYQGTWMSQPCALADGRFAYMTHDVWFGSVARFPNIGVQSSRKPEAVMICEIDDNGVMTPAMYPIRVSRDVLDAETLAWYESVVFFSPEYQTEFDPDGYRADPDGYLANVWDIGTVLPSSRQGYLWLWQGPNPQPYPNALPADAYSIAQYTIDEENQELVFVPGSCAYFGQAYFAPFGMGACTVKDDLFACIGALDYHSRAAPQGWDGGWGTLNLRIFRATLNRGVSIVGDHVQRVHYYPERG